jgi:hypothetical protein
MNKTIWIAAAFILVLGALTAGIVSAWPSVSSRPERAASPLSGHATNKTEQPAVVETAHTYPDVGYFPIFSLNIHDWGDIGESVAAVTRVLDIHEKYGVPVDLYFTDPLFRLYVKQAPELIDRLKTSTVATVAYHIRPPVPYYPGFDWLKLSGYSDKDMYNLVMDYETHALDLSTGRPTDEPGGYKYVADVIGYAPIGVGSVGMGRVGDVVGSVYHDLGAEFMVEHGKTYALGQEAKGGLLYRPEDVALKLYESAPRTQDGGAVIEDAVDGTNPSASRIFVGIKYHEDNFYYTAGTPWLPVYYAGKDRDETLDPPYNLSLGTTGGRMQTALEDKQDWDLYESAVKFVSEHSDEYHAVNLRDLANMVLEEKSL